ncbi:RagB/SusD family nutrient uptake outer membrane protein [Pedobacter sp. ISL-68]|uniref:RagB/SusD family nutrient uptake outer membrane protein n=1 Tax=unclassified Pedobacter TaxID=2628915 RepID=UPI001BEA848F|nr:MULTISPECIES: RagB/SusD family nutrient uptake outer membrane protein [unclassified Pedobacter]MBT2561260.1 RagB/SusD family nutrient uptake outer membrane protein [Pedobacter sp. ISL-64]MBT2590649.1 RagB/SusD family nutrient uptake outer membrane protein [Pedobacter sp. ISL-68]
MKKIYIIILAACTTSLLFSSCKKVLEKQDLGSFTADQVYNDSTTTKLSIDYIYSQNQPAWFGNVGGFSASVSSLSEEQYGDNVFVKGTATIESVTDLGNTNTAGNYVKIRTINMFIRDVNAGTLDPAMKKRFNAQAYFWRAFRYFELVKLYGGVPVVLVPLDAVGEDAKKAALLPRNTTSETFAQIVRDLDSCIKYIPVKWPKNDDYGRITKGAAQAFKGRVLLTFASPEFNPSNVSSRWQDAYAANTQAIATLSTNGFGLYTKFDASMWTTEGSAGGSTPRNPEAVFATLYNTGTTDIGQNNNTYPNATVPKYIGSTGGSNLPTWDMALAFPMKDGKDIGASKYIYSLGTFYKDRDPRFDQTIAYNGCNWPLAGNSSYRLWTYYYTNDKNVLATTEPSGATSSGLYLRKGIDPALTLATFQNAGTDWIEIRYAEVMLNLAECAAETGQSQEAYNNLINIRKRAGIEAGADGLYGLTAGLSGNQLVAAIMKERQIELAFEGKRFWDLRRRKLLESTLNGKRRLGVTITLKNTGTKTDYILGTRDASANTNLDALYASSFTVTTKQLDTYNIAYQPGVYFFGIPTVSLNNNINLVQNNTWGGAFDPLK